MRVWLYNRIKALVLPNGMAARIIASGSADNPARPFITIQMGNEEPFPGMPRSSGAMQIPFTAWIHDAPGSMLDIDEAARALKDGLPTPLGAAVGGMSVYECNWDATGEDAYDDHYGTNTRPVRFTIVARR